MAKMSIGELDHESYRDQVGNVEKHCLTKDKAIGKMHFQVSTAQALIRSSHY